MDNKIVIPQKSSTVNDEQRDKIHSECRVLVCFALFCILCSVIEDLFSIRNMTEKQKVCILVVAIIWVVLLGTYMAIREKKIPHMHGTSEKEQGTSKKFKTHCELQVTWLLIILTRYLCDLRIIKGELIALTLICMVTSVLILHTICLDVIHMMENGMKKAQTSERSNVDTKLSISTDDKYCFCEFLFMSLICLIYNIVAKCLYDLCQIHSKKRAVQIFAFTMLILLLWIVFFVDYIFSRFLRTKHFETATGFSQKNDVSTYDDLLSIIKSTSYYYLTVFISITILGLLMFCFYSTSDICWYVKHMDLNYLYGKKETMWTV